MHRLNQFLDNENEIYEKFPIQTKEEKIVVFK